MVILCVISQIIQHLLIKLRKHNYDAALAITGAIIETSREKLHAERGLKSLKFNFYKIQSTGLPKYLLQLVPTNNHFYILRKPPDIPHYYCGTDTFKNSFFQMSQTNGID